MTMPPDAMGVVHGPGHMEVKYTTTGPCLVEVGTRCHGGEGTWQAIAQECLGYNQASTRSTLKYSYRFWRHGECVRTVARGSGKRISFFVVDISCCVWGVPGNCSSHAGSASIFFRC